MKKITGIILLVSLLSSCDESGLDIPIPKDIIPVDTMITVMSEIAVLENVIQRDYPALVKNTEIVKNSGDEILKSYHLTYERYSNSLEYYTFYTDTMIYIYDRMADEITFKMNELE